MTAEVVQLSPVVDGEAIFGDSDLTWIGPAVIPDRENPALVCKHQAEVDAQWELFKSALREAFPTPGEEARSLVDHFASIVRVIKILDQDRERLARPGSPEFVSYVVLSVALEYRTAVERLVTQIPSGPHDQILNAFKALHDIAREQERFIFMLRHD